MDSEIIRAVQKDKLSAKPGSTASSDVPTKISDDLYVEVISSIKNEFSDPIVAPHWWSKPAKDLKAFRVKTRINNTIWRQWYVHFMMKKETAIKFANPMPLADKYHARTLAVVVEGHYWCRKQRTIRIQYSSWRKKNAREGGTQTDKTKPVAMTNLIAASKPDENCDNNITSPGNDFIFSGMLQGFDDFQNIDLDLNAHFDISNFLPEFSVMPTEQLSITPMECRSSTNGYHPDYMMTPKPTVDMTSLNTLAAAANMSEYYEATAGEYLGAPEATSQYTNSYIAHPAPKGPAYYPPTRLQYCYSAVAKPSQPQYVCAPPPIPPLIPHSYHAPQQYPTNSKQKVSDLESDRKRRRAMKGKLQNLRQVVPLNSMSNGMKITHAALLNSAAEFLLQEELNMKTIESEILKLNSTIEQTREIIATHQRQIPENGITASCFGSNIIDMQYRTFIEEQTAINPLMKVYSYLIEPLFISFNAMVDNTSLDSFCKTAHCWFSQNCSLEKLRELATSLVTRSDLEFAEESVEVVT